MSERERGRLFPIRVDGTESVPFFIKKDRVIFGRGDNCDIRIYVDGVELEHCAVLFNKEGKGFLDPLNNCGLTILNGERIEKEVSLDHNDVITVVKRSFRFLYPLSRVLGRSYQPASLENNMLYMHELIDSELINQKEICHKRVTFGPSLSPEEFDKNLPPSSPVRKGSLPSEKNARLSFQRNLIKDFLADNVGSDADSPKREMPTPTVVLQRLPSISCTSSSCSVDQLDVDLNQSKPFFSEILKKYFKEPENDLNVNKIVEKSSPTRLQKKAPKFQDATLSSPSSGSTTKFDVENNVHSQGSKDHLPLPALRSCCKHDCTSIDWNSIFKTTERNDKTYSLASSDELSKLESNHNIFSREERENICNGQIIPPELLSSASVTVAEDVEDKSDEQNKFLQDINAMQQLSSHSNVSPTFNNDSFFNICMNSLKKLALTISMMSAFHMYNKVMEDISNYSMYFPSTSFDSFKDINCGHQTSSHHNEEHADISKLALFQEVMQNFFTNSVCNRVFEEDRCMLRSCRSSLNSDMPPMCHQNIKKSNIVSSVPVKSVDSQCSSSKCRGIYSHSTRVKGSSGTDDESNFVVKNPCYQNSSKVSMFQGHKKPSEISEASLNLASSTRECNPNSLTISSMQHTSTNELSEFCNVTHKKLVNSKENGNIDTYFDKLNNGHKSFSGASIGKKCVQLTRKSFSPRRFKRNKMSTTSFINDSSSETMLSRDCIRKRLRPRNPVAVKTKQRKFSLGVKKTRITYARKGRAIKRAKKKESCKSESDFIKSCEDQSLKDEEQLSIKRLQTVKRKLEHISIIPERITRATVRKNDVTTIDSTSPVEKVGDWEIAKAKNFEQVEMGINKIHAMKTNLERISLTSARITRSAARKRNVNNVRSDVNIVEFPEINPESTAAPTKKKNEIHSREIKVNQVKVSPVQRITRSMMQKRKRSEK